MRDSDERQRHFVVRDKKEEDYDAPAVRRRGTLRGGEDEREEKDEAPRQPRARKSLRERELEEEEEARSLRGRRKRGRVAEPDDDDFDDDEEQEHKAPGIVRLFAWIALMIILFACGYVATNYFFDWSAEKGGPSAEQRRAAEAPAETEEKAAGVKYTIYVPNGDSFQSRSVEITGGGSREEDITKVLSMYIDSLKETKALDTSVAIAEVFQSGDWLYVDLTPSFLSSLKSQGKAKSATLLNGMLRTVEESFPPLKKIKFYVNSKEITDKNPLDLTQPWEAGR
ncbi:MAG: GerMN domain-containing protein [Synergistaceae bacterium]|nr:GerMN domain-containing protein [Synergistaceae bacterium]